MFILAEQRDLWDPKDLSSSPWDLYAEYLEANRERFPPSAYALATSAWYLNAEDHRCPHDAWLEELVVSEPSRGERHENRVVTLRMKLLGAYHDGTIEVVYPRVYAYEFSLSDAARGHGDWRFDEFRVSDDGRLIHEIEWDLQGGRMRVESNDVHFRWTPFPSEP